MTDNPIHQYYKNVLSKSSVIILFTTLGSISLLFFGFLFFKEYQFNKQNFDYRSNLANKTIDSLISTYTMISNSSFSIIALKYGDFDGYRRVVLPWIGNDLRVKGFYLKDKLGQTKISWGDVDQNLDIANDPLEVEKLTLQGSHLFYKINIKEDGNYLGSIVFVTGGHKRIPYQA